LYIESNEEGGEQTTLTNKMLLRDFYDKKIFVIIKSKLANQDTVRVNRIYQLTDGRIGTCKFIGETRFAKGTWIGLALDEGHGEGKHDGTVYGKRYFRCRAGMGIFVKPDKIRSLMKKDIATGMHEKMKSLVDRDEMKSISLEVLGEIEEEDQNEDLFRSASIEKGWKPADYGLVPDHSNWMKKKNTYLESELRKNFGQKADRKMTIPEFKAWALVGKNMDIINKILNWKAADFNDEKIWEEIRYDISLPLSVLNQNAGLKADKKLGAVDIGRNKDFNPARFEINTDDVDYNITYLKSHLDKNKGEKADRKAGAIETGRNDEYNVANFDYNIEEVDYNITYLKKDLDKNKGIKAEKKLGAIEIGRNEEFKEANYEIKNYEIDYNITYLKKDLDKNKGVKVDKKLGAKEIGRAEGFEGAKYDLNKEDIDYNISRTKKELNRNQDQKIERKLTAIEIGRNEGFKEANYEIKNYDIDYNLTYLKKDLDKNKGVKVDKKLGAIETGRAESFEGAKYDLNKEDNDYNISRTKKDLNRNQDQKVERKLTAIEIGRADNFEAADYKINDEEIDYKLERTKKDLNRNADIKAERKPSHLEELKDSYDLPSKDTKKLVTKPIDITYTLTKCLNKTSEGEAESQEPKIETSLAVSDVRYDICYLLSNLKKIEDLENSTPLTESKAKFKLDRTEIRRDLILIIKDIRRIERKSILEDQQMKSPQLDAIMKFRSELDEMPVQSGTLSIEDCKEEDDIAEEDELSIIIKKNRDLKMPDMGELEDIDKTPISLKPSLLSKVASDH